LEKLIKLFSKDKPKEVITEEEIDSFIDMWKDTGWIDEDEHEKIKSILEFDDITVEEIMTPRVKIDAINTDMTIEKAITYYLSHTHTRIPVYNWTIDKIDYFITSRDLVREVKHWNLSRKLSEIKLRNVLKVPLNQSISVLLESLQKAHKTMSIVVDEYGWVAGLVTIEDIIEQVFGDIRDETDKEAEEFIKVWEDYVRVESDVLIEDVLDEFNLKLEDIWLDNKEFDGETVSYIITHILDRFPKAWEIIDFDVKSNNETWKLSMTILDINDVKIWKVDVKLKLKAKSWKLKAES
jgi:CBS domain containing-hemolysin-like protein